MGVAHHTFAIPRWTWASFRDQHLSHVSNKGTRRPVFGRPRVFLHSGNFEHPRKRCPVRALRMSMTPPHFSHVPTSTSFAIAVRTQAEIPAERPRISARTDASSARLSATTSSRDREPTAIASIAPSSLAVISGRVTCPPWASSASTTARPAAVARSVRPST